MSPVKKKTRRGKRKNRCLSTIRVAGEGPGYKDTASNCICINGSLPYEKHLLRRGSLVGSAGRKLLVNVLNEDVGVKRHDLLTREVKDAMDLSHAIKELDKLWKNRKRLTIYQNLAFKEAEKLFGAVPTIESFPCKVVYHVLFFILSHVIPESLFASKHNFKTFLKSVKRLVFGCHKQRLSLSSLVHGLKVSDILWLQRTVHSNSLRLHMLACLVKWLVLWVQILIRQLWHVTSHASKELMFFSKVFWDKRRNMELQSLVLQGKIKMVPEGSKEREKIKDIASLKFLPKTSGLRPITLFKEHILESNTDLRADARMLLTQLAYLVGSKSTSFSPRMSEFLREGILRILSCHPDPISRPSYYFVRVDVKDAFSSIDHRRMLLTLDDLRKNFLPHDLQMRVWDVKRGRKFVKIFECNKMPPASNWSLDKKAQANGRIDLKPILLHIQRAVHRLGVSYGNQIYKIQEGIPQGMYLSPILSELYYATLDAKHLRDFWQNTQNDELFVRYCDDYLFLTPCKEKAEKFLKIMSQGFPEFNFRINPSKTLSNLSEETPIIPFCGFLIDLETFCVTANFDCYQNLKIAHTLDLSQYKNLGSVLKSRLAVVLKLDAILLDKRLNTKHSIARNIYHAALLMAFRFCAFVDSCFPKSNRNQSFFTKCVLEGERHIRKRVKKVIASTCPGPWLTIYEIKWLVYKAFISRMTQNPSQFGKNLRKLKRWCNNAAGKLNKYQVNLLATVSTPPLPGVFSQIR